MQFTTILSSLLFASTGLSAAIPRAATVYPGLDAVQSKNAEAVIGAVKAAGLTTHGCITVIATALQESTLHVYANPAVPASMNMPHDIVGGDQDSVGIFQQRPGYYPDVAADMSPSGSAAQFIARLKAVPGYETMEPSALAQMVQHAQAGNLYAQRIPLATQVCAAGGFK